MATINGTNGADTLYGTSAADQIFGLGGNDTLKGGGGADRLDGGAGTDTIFYGDSTANVTVNLATGRGFGGTAEGDTYVDIENVFGSSHNDTITGDNRANQLSGLDGIDVLKGGGGADTLDGGSGDDVLKGGGGADHLVGGAGLDTADYSQASEMPGFVSVSVNLLTNTGFTGDAQGDTFDSIENLIGSPFVDRLTGNDVANVLRGMDGTDELFGLAGNDRLEGGNGNDFLDGGGGLDVLIGGPGSDVHVVDQQGDAVIELAGEGTTDLVRTSVSYVLAAGSEIESLFSDAGTAALDLTGNEFGQHMLGNAGSNVLTGLGGADDLFGEAGFDRLFAGDGDDTLKGGLGPDDLFGGTGADLFIYYQVGDTGIAAGSFDVIHDFDRVAGDRVHVTFVDADAATPDEFEDWTFIGNGAFTAPGQIAFSSDGVDTFLLLNDDGDAIQEATIRVLGLHAVDAGWFVL